MPSSLFDELAPEYDEWYKTPLGSLCDALEKTAVFSLANVREGELALDVSCGTGNYIIELARKGARVVGIDSSKKMLEITLTKARETGLIIGLQQADAENLPFTNETFDLVTCIFMLEFTSSRPRVIKEMLRVLKPGGRLVIGVLNKYSLWAFIRRAKSLFVSSIWKDATFISRQDLVELLSSHGCSKLNWKGVIYFPPVNHRLLLRFSGLIEKAGQRVLPSSCAFLATVCKKGE